MDRPWFRVKRYGFGAGAPCSWQGWVLFLGFLVVVLASSVLLLDRNPPLHFAIVLAATAILGVVSWRTSDGPWKWRWGQE